jgi:FkbM family methyltransferase
MKYVKEALSRVANYLPSNFIEIGSMDAKDTLEMIGLFDIPAQSTYVIEASPRRYSEIVANNPDLNVKQCAIWSHDGFIEFNDVVHESGALNRGMGSIRDREDGVYLGGTTKKVIVPCLTGASWLDSLDNDLKDDMHFIKIDTEGCDLDVLLSFGQYLGNIRCVQLEGQKSVIWKGQSTQAEIEKAMLSLGYKEIWRREWTHAFDTMWLRNDLFS